MQIEFRAQLGVDLPSERVENALPIPAYDLHLQLLAKRGCPMPPTRTELRESSVGFCPQESTKAPPLVFN